VLGGPLDRERTLDTTKKYHAITSLDESAWREYGVEGQGILFRDRVKAEILDTINSPYPYGASLFNPIKPIYAYASLALVFGIFFSHMTFYRRKKRE